MTETRRVKTWDAMEEEFGLDDYDNINCQSTFTYGMEEEISEFPGRQVPVSWDLETKTGGWEGWIISEDMLEPKTKVRRN